MAVGTGADVGASRATHTWWNFTVLGADIAFFSLGLSISSAYTVMPLFVHHLTPDNVLVALIPAIRALGLFGPQLLVAPLVERRRHALPFILLVTTLERVPYLILGLGALWLAHSNATILLLLFFLMIFLALFGGGLTYPAWLDMIVRTIPDNWLGRFLGFWTGLGGVLGIGGAAVAALFLAKVGWPVNFALCFILTFATMVVSFVLLSLGREPPRILQTQYASVQLPEGAVVGVTSTATNGSAGLGRQTRELWALIRSDNGLRRLLISNGLVGISTMAGALFAISALKIGGLSDAQVGVETTVLFVAMTGGYFLWGAVGDHFGHRTILVFGSVGAAASALLALSAHGFWPYATIFLLLGFNISAVNLAGFTLITEFGPASRRPTYVALASVSYAPFAIAAPLIGGVLADHWGYSPVFIITAITGVLALLAFQFWVPNPRVRISAAKTV